MANVTDSFNRADGALGNADTGQAWSSVFGGACVIAGNKAVVSVAGTGLAHVVDCGSADHVVKAKFPAAGSVAGGLVARVVDGDNFWGLQMVGGSLYLRKYVGGSATDTIVTQAVNDNDEVEIDCSGNTIITRVNGVQVHNVTDAAHNTATSAGLMCRPSAEYDDFSITVAGGGNTAPVAAITAPATASSYSETDSVNFTGTGTDTEDGALSGASLAWTSDLDGSIGSGTSFSTSALSVGTHTITLTVTDSGALTDTDTITLTVTPSGPSAAITAPLDAAEPEYDSGVSFEGTGSGTLSWFSSLDGALGTGSPLVMSFLTPGTHTITLTDGNATTDEITIEVTSPGLVVLPPEEMDTDRNPVDFAGTVWSVGTGAALQNALDNAVDGDVIEVTANITHTQFSLPARGTSGWVEIRSNVSTATLDALVPQGTRMTPAHFATLGLKTVTTTASNGGWIAETSVEGYRFTAMGFQTTWDNTSGIVRLGGDYADESEICSRFVFDRIYAPGASAGVRIYRFANISASHTAIIDSTIAGMAAGYDNGDAHAFGVWGCRGPYKFQNNRMEGWGEGFIFGGGHAGLTSLAGEPSDIVIRGNHFIKPLAQKGTFPFENVKNGIEFKTGRRVLIENNVIENTWSDSQIGMGLLLKSTTQYEPQYVLSGTQDVEVRWNVFKNVACGAQLAARPEDAGPINDLHRVYIHNNLFDGVNDAANGSEGNGVCFMLSGDLRNVRIEHNTIVKDSLGDYYGIYLGQPGDESTGIVFRSNIIFRNTYGFDHESFAQGAASIAGAWPDGTWSHILVIDPNGYGEAPSLPQPTWEETSDAGVGYTDLAGGGVGYELAVGSDYKAAGHDGEDVGVSDVPLLYTRTAGALSGIFDAGDPEPSVATSVVITVQPGDITTGGTTTISGEIRDQYGVLMATATDTVTLAVASGAASISGDVSEAAAAGAFSLTPTFSTGATGPVTVTASSPGLSSDTSASFTVTALDVPATGPGSNTVGLLRRLLRRQRTKR